MSGSRRRRPTAFQTETICSPSSDRASLSFPRAAGPLPGTCIWLCVEEQPVPGAQQEKARRMRCSKGDGLMQVQEQTQGHGQAPGTRDPLTGQNVQNGQGRSLSCWGNAIKSRASGLPIPLAGTFDVLDAGLKAPVPESITSPQAPPTPEAPSLSSSQ